MNVTNDYVNANGAWKRCPGFNILCTFIKVFTKLSNVDSSLFRLISNISLALLKIFSF